MSEEQLEELRQAVLQQSFLFDDPYAYQSGVQDALGAVAAAIASSEHRSDVRSAAMARSA